MKYKWIDTKHVFDSSVKLTHLGGFCGDTNIHHHAVAIVTEKKAAFRGSSTKKTQHTLEISYGAYGEQGIRKTFPFGTHIKDVKATAQLMVTELIRDGHLISN